MKKYKILLGLTTTPDSDWRGKVEECRKFDIQEIALFPTSINLENRKELYNLLEDSPVKSIPHVHLRTDMKIDELDYLVEKFNTKVFNIHPNKDVHKFLEDFGKHTSNIYVENTDLILDKKELNKFGGLCIDFSHWQDIILRDEKAAVSEMEKVVDEYKVGCSHISAVGSEIQKVQDTKFLDIVYEVYSKHSFSNLNEFDYIKKFVEYLPELISLELENTFADQLKVKKYLEAIINNYKKL